MGCATALGGVAGQRAAGAPKGAGAVAFEAEDVLGGPEDRLDALADRREVRAAAFLVLAVRAHDLGVKRGEVDFEVAARSTSKCLPRKFLSPIRISICAGWRSQRATIWRHTCFARRTDSGFTRHPPLIASVRQLRPRWMVLGECDSALRRAHGTIECRQRARALCPLASERSDRPPWCRRGG
jgi:hypothetical protein